MKLYKLTNSEYCTKNKTLWGPGVKHTIKDPTPGPLCSAAWIHAYTDPRMAVIMNPVHAAFTNPCLFIAKGKVGKTEHGLKVGSKSLTTTKEIPLPIISVTQRVAFGILCARTVFKDKLFQEWVKNWLSGKDRSAAAAYAVATRAADTYAVAYADAAAADAAAADAAAYAAAGAADAAAFAAAYAADAAVADADAAVADAVAFDFTSLLDKAMNIV